MRIGVYGAGAIGGYVGARLAVAGHDVTLLGRPWLAELELAVQDLGQSVQAASPSVIVDPEGLAACELVLVTVKSRHSADAGEVLGRVLPPSTPVVSLQNGLHNPSRIAVGLGREVWAGMVPFNVIREEGLFRKATTGPIHLDRRAEVLGRALRRAGETVHLADDMGAVQAGKLLINLNNGICAAAGLGIAELVADRRARRCYAACIREGLEAFRRAGQPVVRVGALSPALLVRALPLPDGLVHTFAKELVSIDPAATGSTLQDLRRGNPTEIDQLNGEIVALAGERAPVNAWVVEQVKRLEGEHPDHRFVSLDQLLAASA